MKKRKKPQGSLNQLFDLIPKVKLEYEYLSKAQKEFLLARYQIGEFDIRFLESLRAKLSNMRPSQRQSALPMTQPPLPARGEQTDLMEFINPVDLR